MMKSKSLSVMATEPSLASKSPFLHLHRPWIMGVLNATPDSFYPGSRATPLEAALRLADRMVEEGADCLDVGGESTRPGSQPVSADEELSRVLPILDAIHGRWPGLSLSIDTQKSIVARQALAHGAALINDISALSHDPDMAAVVAESDAPVVLMHMSGTPETMQRQPQYDDVVDAIKDFFTERLAFAARQKIREDRIVLDPGIGFGKSVEHNLSILKRLSELKTFGRPILIGVSRKSFIGKQLPPEDRLEGSLAAALWAVQAGASGLRVHDVGATRRALVMWEGIASAS